MMRWHNTHIKHLYELIPILIWISMFAIAPWFGIIIDIVDYGIDFSFGLLLKALLVGICLIVYTLIMIVMFIACIIDYQTYKAKRQKK